MRVMEVQAPGLLTTVQDLGREGFGPMGVSPSGAADAISLRLGNRLVGNGEGAAGLEMTLLGGRFVFWEDAVFALTDRILAQRWTVRPFRCGHRTKRSRGKR